MAGLKKENNVGGALDPNELVEAKRLVIDMGIPIKEIAADANLSSLFANQLAVRMNTGKSYSTDNVIASLKDLAD